MNDLQKYIDLNNERASKMLAGESDHTFTFIQHAYFIQTGIDVPLL